ncbi:MAG: histidine phosphatase family protein [Candidatus Hodarchaeales archaeon]
MVDNPMKITFIRHSQSEGNLKRIIQGQTDFPLSETGKKQAKSLRTLLHDRNDGLIFPYDLIYSSPLSRSLSTAKIVIEGYYDSNLIIIHDKLMEATLGKFEGKLLDDRKVKGDLLKFWDSLSYLPFIDNYLVESEQYFLQRTQEVFIEIVKEGLKSAARSILVFSHYGVIGAILSKYLNLIDLNIRNTEVIVIEIDKSEILDYSKEKPLSPPSILKWKLIERIVPNHSK